jgi:hypothetical protein
MASQHSAGERFAADERFVARHDGRFVDDADSGRPMLRPGRDFVD